MLRLCVFVSCFLGLFCVPKVSSVLCPTCDDQHHVMPMPMPIPLPLIKPKPLKVSIYYETLCSDSVAFIKRQLYPAYDTLKNYIFLDFVPYGKANHVPNDDGGFDFYCQHGPNECYGNKIHACVLSMLQQQQQLEFVECAIGISDTDQVIQCLENVGLEKQMVRNCVGNGQGDKKLALFGVRTHSVFPRINFIPTIIFNNFYNSNIQSGSLIDFLGTACNALRQYQIPGCSYY